MHVNQPSSPRIGVCCILCYIISKWYFILIHSPTPDITWHDANDLSTELSPMDWQRSFDNTHITYTRKLAPSVIKSIVCKGKNKLGEMTQEIKINCEYFMMKKKSLKYNCMRQTQILFVQNFNKAFCKITFNYQVISW